MVVYATSYLRLLGGLACSYVAACCADNVQSIRLQALALSCISRVQAPLRSQGDP